jgi:accessory colonization factor AcfC
LLKQGIKVFVTEGKGAYNISGTGLWEDVDGRKGKLFDVQKLKSNIVAFKKAYAWIIWIDWPISQKDTKEVKVGYVYLSKDRRIYRDLNISASHHSKQKTKEFVKFLKSKESEKLMGEFGWKK